MDISSIGWVHDLARYFVGGTFLLAALLKRQNVAPLARTLAGLGVPTQLLPTTTYAVILLEVVLAALLLLGLVTVIAGLLAIALIAAFAATSAAMTHSLKANSDCGCFGNMLRLTSAQHYALLLTLFGFSLAVVATGNTATSIDVLSLSRGVAILLAVSVSVLILSKSPASALVSATEPLAPSPSRRAFLSLASKAGLGAAAVALLQPSAAPAHAGGGCYCGEHKVCYGGTCTYHSACGCSPCAYRRTCDYYAICGGEPIYCGVWFEWYCNSVFCQQTICCA